MKLGVVVVWRNVDQTSLLYDVRYSYRPLSGIAVVSMLNTDKLTDDISMTIDDHTAYSMNGKNSREKNKFRPLLSASYTIH